MKGLLSFPQKQDNGFHFLFFYNVVHSVPKTFKSKHLKPINPKK